jgi:hypothetical protein
MDASLPDVQPPLRPPSVSVKETPPPQWVTWVGTVTPLPSGWPSQHWVGFPSPTPSSGDSASEKVAPKEKRYA